MLNYKILKEKSVEIIKSNIDERVDFKEYFDYATDVWSVYRDREIDFRDKSIMLEYAIVECINRGCKVVFILEINKFIAAKLQESCKINWINFDKIAKETNDSIRKKYGVK